MRLSFSLGSLLTVDQILHCTNRLKQVKPEVIWIPETWGMENFSMLSSVSLENNFSKIQFCCNWKLPIQYFISNSFQDNRT